MDNRSKWMLLTRYRAHCRRKLEVVDIWIKVNPKEGELLTPDDQSKHLLCCEQSSLTAPIVSASTFRNRLYLGRYTVGENATAMIHRPVPLYLAALKPCDESWNIWAEPLQEIIKSTATNVQLFTQRNSQIELMGSALYGELILLSTDWPVTTFTQVAYRLQRISLLATAFFKRQSFVNEPMLNKLCIPMADINGEELPKQLATILQDVVEKAMADIQNFAPKVGDTLTVVRSGKDCVLKESLGQKEQKNCYSAQVNANQVLLNWYRFDDGSDKRREFLQTIIERGPPSPQFTWPLDIVHSRHGDGFGYIRHLPAKTWRQLLELDAAAFSPVLFDIAINLLLRFKELHHAGLCFVDPSLDDLWLDDVAQVRVLFDDNVGFCNQPSLVEPRSCNLMAYELAQQNVAASESTDNWTLSVLLFRLLLAADPFETAPSKTPFAASEDFSPFVDKHNSPEQNQFLFNPENDSATVDTSVLNHWQRFPSCIQDAFLKVFTTGKNDPTQRLNVSEWLDRLSKVRDRVYTCNNNECQQVAFYGLKNREALVHGSACVVCGKELIVPPRLRTDNGMIVILRPGVVLYAHHFNKKLAHKFDAAIAKVVVLDEKWGLLNCSQEPWTVHYQRREEAVLRPTRAWPLDKEHLDASIAFVDGSVAFGPHNGTIVTEEPLRTIFSDTNNKDQQE